MLSVANEHIVLSVIMLSVVVLNVVVLIDVATAGEAYQLQTLQLIWPI